MEINKYIEECHASDAADTKKRFEATLFKPSTNFPLWTSAGRLGNYIWRSLTSVFVPEKEDLSDVQLMHDNFHYNCAQKGGLYMMSYLHHSIEADPELSFLLDNGNTLIANTDEIYADGMMKNLCIGMREYLRQNCTLNDCDAFDRVENNNLKVISENVKDRHVIVPIPYIWPTEISNLALVLNLLCQYGAKTAFLVSITRIMPTSNGGNPTGLAKALTIPPITGMSFEQMMELYNKK